MHTRSMVGSVEAVSRSELISFSKENQESIKLVRAKGVKGDVQAMRKHRESSGRYVDSLSIDAVQVISMEAIHTLRQEGYRIFPGTLGEHITTRGIDLDNLPLKSRLHFKRGVVLELAGRPAISQYPEFSQDSMSGVWGPLVAGLGIWCRVISGGTIRPMETVEIALSVEREALAEVFS